MYMCIYMCTCLSRDMMVRGKLAGFSSPSTVWIPGMELPS